MNNHNYYRPKAQYPSLAQEVGRFIVYLILVSGWTYFCLMLAVD